MLEFRPPIRRQAARAVLAFLIVLVGGIVPAVGLWPILVGMSSPTYTIAGGALVVRSGDFVAGTRTVPLGELTEVRTETLSGGRRILGTALPGYCTGRFEYRELGTVWQATTCDRHVVVLRAAGEAMPIVLTPPDPDAFTRALRAKTEMVIRLPAPDKGPGSALLLGLGLLAMGAVVAVSLLLVLGPGRMRYEVGNGLLVVHSLFSTKRWIIAGARAGTYTPGRLWRVFGASAPGYCTGIYRESGKRTRVCATEIDRVLLFEGAARIILSPEDRQGMLQALAAQGAIVTPEA
jgi:hypothetical protein